MGIRECLANAVETGDITREEAAALQGDFEARFAQKRLELGDDAAGIAARDELAAELRAQAIEKRRRAVLTEKARLRLKDRILGYRDENGKPNVYEAALQVLSHYGYAGAGSVRGRQEALISTAHGKLTDVMTAFSRSVVTGRRSASAGLQRDVVRELHGEATGDPTAKGLADSLATVFEDLRNRFNAAGGAIPKLDRWGMPHSHNGLAVRQAGRDAWKAFIKPLVDPDRMRHPLTGEPVGVAGLDRALDHVYDTITTTGWAHHAPQMRTAGAGSMATQRQDHRFITFKDGASWMDYNARFGDGDPVQAMFRHINGMAKDIAMMEVLGPNPAAMVLWMKQNVRVEVARMDLGLPSNAKFAGELAKWARGTAPGAFADWRIDALYNELRGSTTAASGVATATSTVKNIMNAALLGGAGILAGATDPFIAQAARRLAGIPVTKGLGKFFAQIKASNRMEIVRAGVIMDDYLHAVEGEIRFTGTMLGHHWSKYLVDRSMMLNLLKPLTTGRRLVEARAWQSTLADHAGDAFGKLPDRLRTTMEGFGIDEADWEIMRASVDPLGFITPSSIAERGGEVRYLRPGPDGPLVDVELMAEEKALRHREVAEKLAELTASWAERSTPSGTPNARSYLSGGLARGTPVGEFIHMATQFKSFGLSFTTLQLEALQQLTAMKGGGRGAAAAYFGSLFITTTIGGAIAMQIINLADGKDVEDMGPENTDFWFRAVMKGGGFGLFGDFLSSSTNRFGGGVGDTVLGPGWSFLSDAVGLTAGNAARLALGQEPNVGRDAVTFAGRYTPLASSHFATRGAYRRLVLDQLQWLVDPEADASFKARARGLKGRTGQDYWWEPGEALPGRGPAVAAVP